MASSASLNIFVDKSPLSARAEELRKTQDRFTERTAPEDWAGIRPFFERKMLPASEQAKEALIATALKGTLSGCPILELTPKTYDESAKKIILYIHGGAFTLGSPECLIQIPAPLAHRTGWKVIAPDYPLAPYAPSEDPHPAHTAVFNVYKELRKKHPDYKIAFLGDSAGGNIAFGVALMARDQKIPLPEAIVAYNPWVDLEQKTPTYFNEKRIAQTVVLTPPSLESARDAAFGKQEEYNDYVSPTHGDYQKEFEKTAVLICPADRDLLREENLLLAEKLQGSAKAVDVFYKKGTWHNYQQDDHLLPEAIECANFVAEFLIRHLDTRA